MSDVDTKTTWDGKPIASEPPFGVSVIVYRHNHDGLEFLILHRAHHGPDYEGDWAWTPPSGARQPGETVIDCARRELWEEAGLSLPIQSTTHGTERWQVYMAEAQLQDSVRLDAEHDRYEWVPLSVAQQRCRPDLVSRPLFAMGAEVNG